jgi:hypothetical protein
MSDLEERPRPRFGRIPDAKHRSGLSRSTLYGLAAKHRGLFVKAGAATLVDLNVLDRIMDTFPPAEIKLPSR